MVQTWLQDHSFVKDEFLSTIKEMIREKGNKCVSIIIPTHRFGQRRFEDRKEIQTTVLAAEEAVQYKSANLMMKIDHLCSQIDLNKNKEGIGIYVSRHVQKIIKFPFNVAKKIVVNNFFHLHDLLYVANYNTKYYLIDISKGFIHLYQGALDHLEEISNADFPQQIKVEPVAYKVAPPLAEALEKADKSLSKVLASETTPLIICGTEENIKTYKSVSHHNDNLIGSISDKYTNVEPEDLQILAWLQIKSFGDQEKLKIISGIRDKIDTGVAVCGVEEVWKAFKESAGATLLVEKDYGRGVFVTRDGRLHLHYPREKHVKYPDAVNEIIATVLQKNGKVIITEKDALRDQKRIVLINSD